MWFRQESAPQFPLCRLKGLYLSFSLSPDSENRGLAFNATNWELLLELMILKIILLEYSLFTVSCTGVQQNEPVKHMHVFTLFEIIFPI